MSKNLLLEIGLEEMPAKVVTPSSQQLVQKMTAFLSANRISHGKIQAYSTPRRLSVLVREIAEKQEDKEESIKGPAKKIALDAEGEWSNAAVGFSRGQGVSTEDIVFKEIKGVEYVYVNKYIEGKATKEMLTQLKDVITSLTFPVSMHWANYSFRYIRPIHWITAMLDDEIIPFSVLDIKTSNVSFGHRFLGKTTEIKTALAYEESLEKEYVIPDSSKRKQMIIDQINSLTKKQDWSVAVDEDLLEEITNLVEYPTVFFGSFNERYLALPEEILMTSMKEHQRYFSVHDTSGKLLPYFISVRNGDQHFIATVAKGNEKVLTARLDDANFFYDEDRTLTIADYVEQLKKVTFHERIGTIYEKMKRVASFAETIGERVGLSEEEQLDLKRAANIYKFDLVTNIVGEFPELQGIMGEKYALLQGEKPGVAAAIREHYLPISSEGRLPESSVGAVLAIADKLDSVMSFFAAEMIPTGSNDPYALRRQAYGIIRIVEAKGWSFPLQSIQKTIVERLSDSSETIVDGFKKSSQKLQDFMEARIRQLLIGRHIRHDVVEAVLHSDQEDLNQVIKTGRIINNHLEDPSFKPTMESLTRVLNLIKKSRELIKKHEFDVDPELFEKDSEKQLFDAVEQLEPVSVQTDVEQHYHALEKLQPFIDAFFNENMVMAKDEKLRNNRLALLVKISCLIVSFASVDELVVE